jgi:hypothetical protein
MIGEDAVIRELGFEANTKYINDAYRNSLAASFFVLARVWVKALFRRHSGSTEEQWMLPGCTLAFSMFKNERSAIEEYIQQGASISHVRLNFQDAKGLNFSAVLCGGIVHFPWFLYRLVREYGFGALRRMAYPFLGYAVYRHLRVRFRNVRPAGIVITTNMVHPVSLAIHYAAAAEGWATVFLEHAMTPKLIAKDRGYSKILVRSSHTKEMLVDLGMRRETIDVLGYWSLPSRPAQISPAAVKRLGYCVNSLDDLSDIEYLVPLLVGRGIHCEIRVHDADKRYAALCALGARFGASISSAAESEISGYIRRQDLVVVGNSGVLLDCLREDAPAIYFWTGAAELYDYYGLVAYMGFPSARSRQELLRLLGV